MILEDRKVDKEVFLGLQREAINTARLAGDNVQNAKQLLKAAGLGAQFSLVSLIENLAGFGLDFQRQDRHSRLDFPFLSNLINCCTRSVLRDIKFRARIQVPRGWSLVGVADEGPAYIKNGRNPEEVFTLKEGEIYGKHSFFSEKSKSTSYNIVKLASNWIRILSHSILKRNA